MGYASPNPQAEYKCCITCTGFRSKFNKYGQSTNSQNYPENTSGGHYFKE